MTEIEMTEFFESYGQMPAFSRIKKIYDITNNLDLFLLKILRSDFRRYSLKKYFQLVKDFHSGKISEVGYEYNSTMSFIESYNLKKNDLIIDIKDETFDEIVWSLSERDCEEAEIIFEGMSEFLYEIDELIRHEQNEIKKSSPVNNNTEKEEEELIDYSENSFSSKVIFLEKLGVIEYLKNKTPFNTSVNSLANALSGVTGVKATTLQPMLNAMISKGVSDKNNPLKSIKTVNVVINKLTNIGYKP